VLCFHPGVNSSFPPSFLVNIAHKIVVLSKYNQIERKNKIFISYFLHPTCQRLNRERRKQAAEKYDLAF